MINSCPCLIQFTCCGKVVNFLAKPLILYVYLLLVSIYVFDNKNDLSCKILHVHVRHSFRYLNVSFKVVAGYDNGLDPRQPRDLKVPEYSKLVSSNNKRL